MHHDVLSSSFFLSLRHPEEQMYPRLSSLAFFSVTNSVWRYRREAGWVGGRRDYVTKLPAWHGRQITASDVREEVGKFGNFTKCFVRREKGVRRAAWR